MKIEFPVKEHNPDAGHFFARLAVAAAIAAVILVFSILRFSHTLDIPEIDGEVFLPDFASVSDLPVGWHFAGREEPETGAVEYVFSTAGGEPVSLSFVLYYLPSLPEP